jgi:tetratricopeptide (TPR) repeat protein
VVEAQRGRPTRRRRLIRDALRINPNPAEAHFSRGNVLLQFRRPDDALAAFERALELNINGSRSSPPSCNESRMMPQ